MRIENSNQLSHQKELQDSEVSSTALLDQLKVKISVAPFCFSVLQYYRISLGRILAMLRKL